MASCYNRRNSNDKPARLVCESVLYTWYLPARLKLTSNGCRNLSGFVQKSALKPENRKQKGRKINITFARPSKTFQLISCFKHSTTLANAFGCIPLYEHWRVVAQWLLWHRGPPVRALVSGNRGPHVLHLEYQQIVLKGSLCEASSYRDHVGPGGLKHTDDIYLCRVGIVGVIILRVVGLN